MNGQHINREWDGFWWLDQIDDAVKRRAYDCTCQVGGVDAMSIDTDWLRHAARRIRNEHRAMTERAQVAEARIKAARDLHRPVGLTEHTGPRIKPDGTPIPDDTPVCEYCTDPDAIGWFDWPCPTIEALNGDA